MDWLFLLAGLTAGPAALNAADPRAPETPRPHCSVLRPAQPASAPRPLDWAQANAQVHAAGGWRAYAKEAAAAPPPPSSACAASGGAR